jgi:two-component system sensor histidine kinase CpxA
MKKLKISLFYQICLLLILNLFLLVVIKNVISSSQFDLGIESMLQRPLAEKMSVISIALDKELQSLPKSSWNEVLDEFGSLYGVKFYLLDNVGKQIAGTRLTIPNSVAEKINERKNRLSELDSEHITPTKLSKQFLQQQNKKIKKQRSLCSFFLHTSMPETFWIGLISPLKENFGATTVLLCSSPSLWQTILFSDLSHLLFLIAIVFITFIVVWAPFIFSMTREICRLTVATERVAEGKFDTTLPVRRGDEIGRLTVAINRMSRRLNAYVTGQKRFLGDISHELCSPVSRLQIALGILEQSSTPEQQIAIDDIRQEAEQMSSLINELLAFSEAGIKGSQTKLVSIDAGSLTRRVVHKTCKYENSLQLDIGKDLYCLGDQTLLERALGNILRNSVRYSSGSGPITVQVASSGRHIYITILDCGPGVPPEAIKFLGEPFYRLEPSRDRSAGGVGLGLAIVKTCIEACQGSVEVCNREPRGLEVRIRLEKAPLAIST